MIYEGSYTSNDNNNKFDEFEKKGFDNCTKEELIWCIRHLKWAYKDLESTYWSAVD